MFIGSRNEISLALYTRDVYSLQFEGSLYAYCEQRKLMYTASLEV
jgi:hypothetical protein